MESDVTRDYLVGQLQKEQAMLKRERDAAVERARFAEDAANRDELTGLPNRRYLITRMRELLDPPEEGSREESKLPLSVLFIDLRRFKQVNDEFGHQAGDEVLQAFAGILTTTLRGSDIASHAEAELADESSGRLGGDEFLVLLPKTNAAGAQRVVERLHAAITAHEAELRGVTADIGISTMTEPGDPSTLLEEADQRMYRQKVRGGSNVDASSKD